MGLLIIFICIIGLAIFLCQKFNVSKKSCINNWHSITYYWNNNIFIM